jgi:dimethylamine monooxygenase subunit A
MVPRESGGREMTFGAGSVSVPNRWDLRSKLGRTMTEVHAPVSRLNEQLGRPIAQFFERLQPDKSFWRLGWDVIDTADLFPAGEQRCGTPDTPERDDMHVRVERETLRRLPRTDAVLFTIRTYITKASALRRPAPDDADRLAEALAAMPADVRAYKQVDVFQPVLQRPFARPMGVARDT